MSRQKPDLLYDAATIASKVDELADRISADYRKVDEIVLVGVLKGAFIFLADLSRRLSVPTRVDFVGLASYGSGAVSSGAVRLLLDLREDIRDCHVLVVDDIIDTGSTLAYLLRLLASRKPASLKSCVLVRKSKRRRAEVEVDYVGFDIEDVWVVGYGLDFADQQRTLPYIGAIRVPRI